MTQQFEMKDSGKREAQGNAGAVRDSREGKGRYDLISPIALKRLAVVYEKGAAKYEDRNWEKGIPLMRCFDSARRHLDQWLMGHTDEDHLGQALWNIAAIIHLSVTHPELDDRPTYPALFANPGPELPVNMLMPPTGILGNIRVGAVVGASRTDGTDGTDGTGQRLSRGGEPLE